jgi:hypothetical protein
MPSTTFDTAQLRAYPLSEVIADFGRQYFITLSTQGRARYLAAIGRLDPPLRTLALLETLHQGMGRDGLRAFLFMAAGDVAPEMLMALREAGLERERQLLAVALALFGPSYPSDHRLREKLFGYWYGPEPNAFDLRLMAIAEAFGDKTTLEARIESFVQRSPSLRQHIARHLATIHEETRLS